MRAGPQTETGGAPGRPAGPSGESHEEAGDVKHVSRGHQEVFCRPGAAEEWDQIVFGPDTYYTFIWELQRQAVQEVARRLAKERTAVRHLDFACGTGRVLHA